jgi:hypothetical protein
MKKHSVLLILFLQLSSLESWSKYPTPSAEELQNISIIPTRYKQFLFYGINNDVSVTLPTGYSFRFDDCEVTSYSIGYKVKPLKKEKIIVYIFKSEEDKQKDNPFYKIEFRVLDLPMPVIKIGKGSSRLTSIEQLSLLKEFECRQSYHFEYYLDYKIISFDGKIIRGDKVIYTWKQNGSLISKELNATFKMLKEDDQIIMYNSSVNFGDNNELIKIDPTIFQIQ